MKKLLSFAMVALMLFAFSPMQLRAADENAPTPVELVSTSNEKISRNDELSLRLNEINEMDKTDLKFSEKKELRKEVRSIKNELKETPGGIYISVGGVIIIILLLIILL